MEEEQFMIVRIGNEPYGIKINDVKEVVPNSEIINVPDKESIYICGCMKCRYGCVSVFDIYRLFGIKSFSINRVMIIILVFDKKFLAFSTEQVDCVVYASHEKIYDIPSMLNNASQRYMKKVIVLDNHLVPIIDTARLLEKAGVLEETELISQ